VSEIGEKRGDEQRLRRLMGDPAIGWLLQRLRRRLELGHPLQGVVTLQDPSSEQRRAVSRLLGRAPAAGSALSVSLDALEQVMRDSGASPDGLAAAVIALTGTVAVRSTTLEAERAAWEQAFAPLIDAVGARMAADGEQGERLAAWLAHLRASGSVKRLEPDSETAGLLLQALAEVITALPANGEPLGRFAARVAGGAHALDDGRPLATLALGAARSIAGLQPCAPGESQTESRREAWAGVGLLCDELSSVVLTLGLPEDTRTGTGGILRAARECGQPVWLTLRQLVRDPPALVRQSRSLAGTTVHICENPVIVSLAADRLGPRSAPLVCTNGQPTAATITLLRALRAAGADLAHHGDFDWGGIRIGNVLHARLSVRPWRFDAQTYLRLAEDAPPTQRLSGRQANAAWDPALSDAMRRVGQRVEEESVADELLVDLDA
jgi:uncharacterized protein (TIGR02679 family)